MKPRCHAQVLIAIVFLTVYPYWTFSKVFSQDSTLVDRVVQTGEEQRDPLQSQVIGAAAPSTEPEIYGQGVRDSSWQSPEKEQQGFHLAPDFEIRLFASEPMIAKPMNMAFDKRGRLWVTQTVEYPYPAEEGREPRDAVMILEDTDGDGHADRSTPFAKGLNIPIGLLPYGDGCICFSIPNLLYLRDTDGDDICDRREIILGPFDTTRDTHGMINALRDGGDGWIYACHGFNNQSQVSGSDGHVVTMNSGNTFRFRPDGSRIEQVTHGQVNPFGMATDEWGYRYSADCHSKPITQLIAGACYPSFGRPHDGLGFLAPMLDHLHGSTAICGLVSYPSDSVIPVLRGNMLSGNVMTSRINRNRVEYRGATAKGYELPDFMTSDDPWFRPVDLQVGPDSHLYIADFYNKIIGHYEVPLTHPDRDRESGRIWQVRYTGVNSIHNNDLSKNDERYEKSVVSERINRLHQEFTEGGISTEQLISTIQNGSAQLAVAALRLTRESMKRSGAEKASLVQMLREQVHSGNAHAVQAASEILGHHGSTTDIPVLLQRLAHVPESDQVLRQTMRIAIRNLYQRAAKDSPIWDEVPTRAAASIFLGLNRKEVSKGLLLYLDQHPSEPALNEMLTHAVQLTPETDLEHCVRIADRLTRNSEDHREVLMQLLLDSFSSRPHPEVLRSWVTRHVQERLQRLVDQKHIMSWSVTGSGIWPLQTRSKTGGGELTISSSIGRGESYVGNRTSDPFTAPEKITFWLAGHNGYPDQGSHKKNRVQLVRSKDSVVLKEAFPPRSDIAIPIEWELDKEVGEKVRIRIIDGDQADAYAWLGVGGFEPSWLDHSEVAHRLQTALDLAKNIQLAEASILLESLLNSDTFSTGLKSSVAYTLASLNQQRSAATLLQHASELDLPASTLNILLSTEFAKGEIDQQPIAKEIFQRLTQSQQAALASTWISEGASIDTLLQFSEIGIFSPSTLARPEIFQLLDSSMNDDERSRHEILTESIHLETELDGKLTKLQDSFTFSDGNLTRGQLLYTKHCTNCHQLAGQGKTVGPQLDGAVKRTVNRLLEDIVTPNRNVDHAFRTTSLLMEDGRVITGLIIRESDKEIFLTDAAGKQIHVPNEQVAQRKASTRSLMPNNFSELLTADDFKNLLAYLKSSH